MCYYNGKEFERNCDRCSDLTAGFLQGFSGVQALEVYWLILDLDLIFLKPDLHFYPSCLDDNIGFYFLRKRYARPLLKTCNPQYVLKKRYSPPIVCVSVQFQLNI